MKKAFMSLCILTALAIIFVSFLLITVGPVRSAAGGIDCKIFPLNPNDKGQHCANCPSGDTEHYCNKNDCSCAENQCLYWVDSQICDTISVCGAVCNDPNTMPSCTLSDGTLNTKTGLYEYKTATGGIVTCSGGTCPEGEICGKAPAGGYCNPDEYVYCTFGRCNLETNKCEGNVYPEWCNYNPDDPDAGDEDCAEGYICCPNGCFPGTDFNRDCVVDIYDVVAVASKFGCVDGGKDTGLCTTLTTTTLPYL